MREKNWIICSEDDMVSLGERLGLTLAAQTDGVKVFLTGTLGAGKTTLSRGILRGFGYRGAVKSPTYTLVEVYEFENRRVHHFDLYRLGNPEELEYLGIRDYFSAGDVCLVEWPERGMGVLPSADWQVNLISTGGERKVLLNATSILGERVLEVFLSEVE